MPDAIGDSLLFEEIFMMLQNVNIPSYVKERALNFQFDR